MRYDKGKTADRGYGYRWQQARLVHLRMHPLCVMCAKLGRAVQATVVDHIKPHKGNQSLFWDATNWQSLCKQHHDSDKQRLERTGRVRETIGVDGYPVPTRGV